MGLLLPTLFDLLFWLVFGWAGVLLIPVALLATGGREIIEIDDDVLFIRRNEA